MGQRVAYGTLLNSFCYKFDTSTGGTYAIMGRESHDSTLLPMLTGSHIAYGIHMTISILGWIKFYKI